MSNEDKDEQEEILSNISSSTVVYILCDFDTPISLKRLKSEYAHIKSRMLIDWKWIMECAKKQTIVDIDEYTF